MPGLPTKETAMIRTLAAFALAALAACTNPTFSTEMAISNDGLSVKPTLSGNVGGATVSVEPY
jgi:hypothetical protein